MTQRSKSNNEILSRSGYPKPLTAPQIRALKVIDEELVYFRSRFGDVLGIRADTFEVLERNGLVKVVDEADNPGQLERHAVRLTDFGREALDRAPEVGPGPPPGGFRRRRR